MKMFRYVSACALMQTGTFLYLLADKLAPATDERFWFIFAANGCYSVGIAFILGVDFFVGKE